MIEKRISILDSFRALAIVAVLLFHYFSRWTPPRNQLSLYPYHGAYDYFGYGNLGVEFFFIISGFVIFFTLDNTVDFVTFWKKRLIRLLPSIVIASITTLLFFRLFDNFNAFPESHELKNLIPSVLFVQPMLLNSLFGNEHVHFSYINGSYWSLWPEIQFYFVASLFYYTSKQHFVRNFGLTAACLIAVNYLVRNFQVSNSFHLQAPPSFITGYVKWMENGFDLLDHLHFFLLGVLFYLLYKNDASKTKTPTSIKIGLGILLLFTVHCGIDAEVKFIYVLMLLLFFLFIYRPRYLHFLENKPLTKIGEASYFLYLIHESIGVLIIYLIGSYFLPYGFVLPALLIIALIVISIAYTTTIEKKISRWLKARIIKR
jgi:peptidoglycan/LPS O-acetylase OafA/YrhL